MVDRWDDGKAAEVTLTYQDEEQARFAVYDDGQVLAHTEKGIFGWKGPEKYELGSDEFETVVDPVFSEADQAAFTGGHRTQNGYGVEIEYEFNPAWNPDQEEIRAVWDDMSLRAGDDQDVYESFITLLENHPEAQDSAEEVLAEQPTEVKSFIKTALEQTENQTAEAD